VTQAAVTLEVNQTAAFDFHLKIGESQQSVTVEAIAAGVESSTSELGTVVATQEMNDLPLNGRNFTQLLTITPGVANINRDQSGTGMGAGGGGFAGAAIGVASFPSINGARVRSNEFLLDGVNDLNTFLRTYNFAPIVDDIQEFKTQGHNDLAEYGGVMGGIVSVVSKSGIEPIPRHVVGVPAQCGHGCPRVLQRRAPAASLEPVWRRVRRPHLDSQNL
jgi:hypothetical protein